MIMIKLCKKCGQEKTIDLFSKSQTYMCKMCWADKMKEYYKKNPEPFKSRSKRYFNSAQFGIDRDVVIIRDNERCIHCGMTRIQHRDKWGVDLTIDHIDGRGRYSNEKNNDLDNLQTLCLSCHGRKDERRRLVRSGGSKRKAF